MPNPLAPGGFVTVSLGMSAAEDHDAGAAVAELVASADSALYEAKRAGRDRIAYARPAGRRRA
jgi:GGDEF domain-containing protein